MLPILKLDYIIVLKYCCHGINVVHTCCSLCHRLDEVEMVTFNEGQESNEFSTLVGDKSLYVSLTNGMFYMYVWLLIIMALAD